MCSARITEVTVDGNEAVASVAHRVSEVVAIYPITPASPMGELADAWSADGRANVWGTVPTIVQMQSEAGAAGVLHGALQAGSMATTFTSSQGLLLMIPNLYKIAGELTPFALHVAARTIATHALSIFGDHSDVMACRQTGFALLASGSVQEAHDLAAVAHTATLRARVPFMHFFDGFRTSHEIAKISQLSDEQLLAMMDAPSIRAHRERRLTPDHPVLRGTAQNPDAFFQAREAGNRFYDATPGIVTEAMAALAAMTGRRYRLFDYVGHPEAERVIVMMGSGAETAHATVLRLVERGERVGLVKVRLYRPFDRAALAAALPRTARAVAVLDRTKEPGAVGEPLYVDVVTALRELEDDGVLRAPRVVGGRYGLSSKEFTPPMVKRVLDELSREKPRRTFTIGIRDDVTQLSLDVREPMDVEPAGTIRALMFGIGSDGTVGAAKSAIKIIGEETSLHAQGYFAYDSKKSGTLTVSHLRFGREPIQAPYLVERAGYLACHAPVLLDRHDVLEHAAPGATVVLNVRGGAASAWAALPVEAQEQVIDQKLELWAVDAFDVAREAGIDGHVGVIMEICFFARSGALPLDEALEHVRASIRKTYGKKGDAVVAANLRAVDLTLARLGRIDVPAAPTTTRRRPPIVSERTPDRVARVLGLLMSGHGDLLPVSAFPVDGTWPTGTSQYEKRDIARETPVWDAPLCIQCNKCALVCPHAAIRAKVFSPDRLPELPATFETLTYKSPDFAGSRYTLQVSPDDCTGCGLCVAVCPAHDKAHPEHRALALAPIEEHHERQRADFEAFLAIPEADRAKVRLDVKGSQLLQPLFEFSGACAGCGETPYIKLLTQLFGDRLMIANATGCSSIFGGNLPTTPYAKNADGRGPAWSNSLFEDNAEFGLGFRLAADVRRDQARALVKKLATTLGDLATALLDADQSSEAALFEQRARVDALRAALSGRDDADARALVELADDLVKKSVWLVGGDGWAYDIGFGGLDHVLSTHHDVNVLVLDTEVYSNTGGQQSKATPRAATARFASHGKDTGEKDLALQVMTYGHAYVARVAFGAKDAHTVKVLQEAESYPGPSLVLAYAHCVAHGYDMEAGLEHQKLAVAAGAWPLFRFDPRRVAKGEAPMVLDSAPPSVSLEDFMASETRFRGLKTIDASRYARLHAEARQEAAQRYAVYEQLSKVMIAGKVVGD